MKLLQLRYDSHATDSASAPTLLLTTDSSIIDRGLPVFLPEISERWRCEISPAYRIDRLGKGIAERFASRYYREMTLVARMVPVDLCGESGPLTVWESAFDGAVALGRWIEAAPIETLALTSPVIASSVNPQAPIDAAISLLSRTMILKSGDIVVPSGPTLSFDASPDMRVTASINSNEVLSFNIK